MDFKTFKTLVSSVGIGKHLPDAVYVHISAFEGLPTELSTLCVKVANAVKLQESDWNMVKLYKRDYKLSYLNYPHFETDSYPALHQSYTIDLAKLAVRKAEYTNSDNPPILHRKETFVLDTHPLKNHFEILTQEGEQIGLYENVRTIGFKKNWERLIASKGYVIAEDGHLKRKSEMTIETATEILFDGTIERHKTAIDRNHLSQPMKILARHNYLNGELSVLDYGCGKGDDVRELEAHGIDVSGWDPVHNPEGLLVESDIVNLGFVLNVIEERDERTETLKRAWEYANTMLIVSVMVAGDSFIEQFTPYKDGVVTSRNTFQKYYSQSEIREYVESTLSETAIAVGQGIFLIFKDKIEEQLFLIERQHIRRSWQQKTQREIREHTPALKKDIIDKHIELFTDFWNTCLDLGRIPANDEFEFSDQIRRVAGSHMKAHQALVTHFGNELFEEAKQKRREDLLVYFALGMFEKRKPQTQLPESLKKDIKAFFTSYGNATDTARELLFSVGNPLTILNACTAAYEKLKTGLMVEGHSYTFHKQYLGDLPPELRVYIGCATQLYGDLEDIHLIKAHITSGKVSLMRYDDWEKDVPLLMERIKIKMRERDVDFFEYGEKFEPTPLQNRNVYL